MSGAGAAEAARPFAGRHIVVTRPAAQAAALVAAIERSGGTAVLFPVLEIRDVEDKGPLLAAADRLEEFDLAVFVSPNAVDKALGAVAARRPWPPGLRAAAMGETSARELARYGVRDVLLPRGRSDSEALLAHAELQAERVRGKRIVIFRGDAGRELLGETLAARGAQVEFVACYRRGRPQADARPLRELAARGDLSALTVTSSEGLRNLVDMAGGAPWLLQVPLFLPHERIAEEARRLGFREVVRTGAGDEGLLAGLIAYFTSRAQ